MDPESQQLNLNKKPDVLAIIPARGGSKGIPRKNIIDLCGKPLIAYTIEAALKTEMITRVIVSTEDEEIAKTAKTWGAEVPFLRPKEYAQDTSHVGKAINYTLNKLECSGTDRVIVTLFPTSPFRTPMFIDEMLRILFRGFDSVSTVKKVSIDPALLFTKEERTGRIKNLLDTPIPYWKKYYRHYGIFHAQQQRIHGKHYFHVVSDKCMLIDIDTPRDLLVAEAVINKGFFEFKV